MLQKPTAEAPGPKAQPNRSSNSPVVSLPNQALPFDSICDKITRASKRQKDWADIMRLAETYPRLISLLPDSLRDKFIAEQEEY